MPNSESLTYFGKDLEAMSFAHNYHRWIVDEFAPYLGDSVAEIGAGTGNFSALLLKQPIARLLSFEPSQNMFPQLAQSLKNQDRANAKNIYFNATGYEQSFSSICYVNVLEHIEDDAAELQQAFKALQPGGHLLIFVPALSWLLSDFDKKIGHYRRYHKGPLKELVQQAGFSIRHARYFDIAGIAPWYLNFVLFKNSLGGGSVSIYDQLVVPIMRRVESQLRPPVGKNILLIAQKK